MAEPSTHINYSSEDIQRYLQGKMSAAEMHAIEKAALQDPFLADAIEGYSEASSITAEQHLNQINAALQNKAQHSKVIPITKNFQWLRIAALVIVLAGIGLTGAYFFKNTNRQQNVAQVKKEAIKPNDNLAKESTAANTIPGTSLSNNNTATVTAQNKASVRSYPAKKEERSLPNVPADTIASTVSEDKSTTALMAAQTSQNETSRSFTPAPSTQMIDTVQYDLKAKTYGLNVTSNIFTGKVIDENNKPVPGAMIETNDKRNTAVTDMNGIFLLQKNDSQLNVTASSVGYEPQSAFLKPRDSNTIMLKENQSALNDVVVTGYSAKTSLSSQQTPTPIGGWTKFNSYVLEKLNEDSTNETNYMSGKDIVELEFLIDKQGNPYNIQITKPLDDKRNSKAINILKSGPKWTNTSKKKKAKVAIAF